MLVSEAEAAEHTPYITFTHIISTYCKAFSCHINISFLSFKIENLNLKKKNYFRMQVK